MKFKVKSSKFLILACISFCFTCAYAQNTYYVAKTGSNSYTATQARNPLTPWLTIQKAADNIAGGDIVIIAGGTYNEKVTIGSSKSGTSALRTTFKNATGQTVIVDGGVTNTNAAVVSGSNTNRFQSQFLISGASYVTIKGIKVQNAQWYGISAETNAHYTTIDGCATFNTGASGIYVKTSNNIEVINNDVQKACQITTRGLNNSGTQECISIVAVDYFKVSYNEVSNSTVSGSVGGEGIDVKGGSSEGEVSFNYIHHIVPLGIYIDAGSMLQSNIRVFSNRAYGTAGLSVAGELGGPSSDIYIYNNIIKESTGSGLVFQSIGNGQFTNVYIVNNTFYNNCVNTTTNFMGDIGSYGTQAGNANLVIRNNIFYNKGTQSKFSIWYNTPSAFTVSHNLYFDFIRSNNGSLSFTTANLTAADLQVDPRFTNVALNDYSLLPTSAAINRGIPITLPNSTTLMFTTDFNGNSKGTSNWDMGAFEYTGIIPVELLTFKGKNRAGVNELTWATATETNTTHFDIERSVDGKTFEKIGKVKARGSNADYTFLDEKVDKNILYYRLTINDLDGHSTFSKIINIASTVKSTVKIYPSVSNGILTVEGAKSFEIVNAFGQIVFSEKAAMPTTTCDIQRFPSGFYLVKGLNTEGSVFTEKIVKN